MNNPSSTEIPPIPPRCNLNNTLEETQSDTDEMLSEELLGGFLDFFMTLFNNILYKTSNFPKAAFFFVEMFNTSMPVCEHEQVAEYIEMCSKKLVSLCSTNCLDGFQLNFMDQSIIVQRFVFVLQGTFAFAPLNKTKVLRILEEVAANARDINEQLSHNEDLMIFKQKTVNEFTRFQIVLGLTEPTFNLYNSSVHCPFTTDPDSDVFPWSKPKKRVPTTLQGPILDKNMISCSQPPSQHTTASKENSPSPETSRKNGFSTPPLVQTLVSKANILVDSPVQQTQLITDKALPSHESDSHFYKDIHNFLISTNKFGDTLCLSFHGVTYANHTNGKLLTSRSKFSPNNIDSPGLYRSTTTLNNSPRTHKRRHQLQQSSSRCSMSSSTNKGSGSPQTSLLASATGLIRTRLSPVSSQVPYSNMSRFNLSPNRSVGLSTGSNWRPRSARSLNKAFDISATSTLSSETQARLNLRFSRISRP